VALLLLAAAETKTSLISESFKNKYKIKVLISARVFVSEGAFLVLTLH